MRRVAVTGFGIVSSIGIGANEVIASLREARSGIIAAPEYAELGFRCQVHGKPQIDWEAMVDRRAARFLAAGTGYAHIAMEQAIADAGLTEAEVSNERTGLVVGSGGPSTRTIVESADIDNQIMLAFRLARRAEWLCNHQQAKATGGNDANRILHHAVASPRAQPQGRT